ncbi:multidrug transporter MatE [Labrys miyagiensis]|uniref:Multidrug transporter MatE n=1 Tax=Labrys miyagiensis TaxID=346912 RepID=A0ABQ6CHG7_9HYPH|nr:AbrB/MazE/SpoVT family DNA-binding domain-containing protein [Labrys miyagiensis]GLS18295.1 multidrug transporter MatE [Labrys miyagiensis]
MEVVVSKWGNSLGLRLPRALVQQIGISEGQTVSVVAEGNRLIVEGATPSYRLEDLLVNVTPEAMGAAFEWGVDVGGEIVDD